MSIRPHSISPPLQAPTQATFPPLQSGLDDRRASAVERGIAPEDRAPMFGPLTSSAQTWGNAPPQPVHAGPSTAQPSLDDAPVKLYRSHHAISATRYASSVDPRGYIPVFEYPLNNTTIMIDSDTGYVLLTSIWKALGNSKTDVIKLLDSQPELRSVVKKVRGGYLKIQGTWVPFATAQELARRVAYYIRDDLIPLFGPGFPETCLTPSQPGYGKLVLSEPKRRRSQSAAARARARSLRQSPPRSTSRLSAPAPPASYPSPYGAMQAPYSTSSAHASTSSSGGNSSSGETPYPAYGYPASTSYLGPSQATGSRPRSSTDTAFYSYLQPPRLADFGSASRGIVDRNRPELHRYAPYGPVSFASVPPFPSNRAWQGLPQPSGLVAPDQQSVLGSRWSTAPLAEQCRQAGTFVAEEDGSSYGRPRLPSLSSQIARSVDSPVFGTGEINISPTGYSAGSNESHASSAPRIASPPSAASGPAAPDAPGQGSNPFTAPHWQVLPTAQWKNPPPSRPLSTSEFHAPSPSAEPFSPQAQQPLALTHSSSTFGDSAAPPASLPPLSSSFHAQDAGSSAGQQRFPTLPPFSSFTTRSPITPFYYQPPPASLPRQQLARSPLPYQPYPTDPSSTSHAPAMALFPPTPATNNQAGSGGSSVWQASQQSEEPCISSSAQDTQGQASSSQPSTRHRDSGFDSPELPSI